MRRFGEYNERMRVLVLANRMWKWLLAGVLFWNLAALPGMGFWDAHDPDWVPLEEEAAIHELQYPELHPPVPYLPDLRTLPPTDLLLQILRGQGVTRLRFTNTIWNSGPGHLELRATPSPLPGVVHVAQFILLSDGSAVQHAAGLFDFHEAHGHWHWVGFSVYQVWSVGSDGQLDELVASSDKVGYCLIDVAPYEGEQAAAHLNGPPAPLVRYYTGCVWQQQGISAGWTDSYKSHIGGQFVDITLLSAGVYALKSIVDPDNLIREVDDENNGAVVYFRLEGEKLEVLGERYVVVEGGQRPQ